MARKHEKGNTAIFPEKSVRDSKDIIDKTRKMHIIKPKDCNGIIMRPVWQKNMGKVYSAVVI